MSSRVVQNILSEAELLESMYGPSDGAMARYGADLLGRAIGREHQATAPGSATDLRGYHPIIAAAAETFTATHRAMVLMAAREV